MSLIVDCKFCGERISLRKMPHGKHVPFDANTDDQHSCQKSKKQKKQTKKIKSKSKSNNESDSSITNEDLYNYDEYSSTENNTSKRKDIFEDETLDTLKNELEGKGEGTDLDEKDFEKITNVMSNLLKGMDNESK